MRDRSRYDLAAPEFNRRRALPAHIPARIRDAVLAATAPLPRPRILDLGAGAGRIGSAFVAAGDDYVGVDLSTAMLDAFRAQVPMASLVLADAARLPFADAGFDAILMVQVLNSTQDWRQPLNEVRRVLQPAGALILGRREAQADGIDARLKQRLAEILADMGVDPYRPAAREDALGWLTATAASVETRIVDCWSEQRTPRQFIERHGTGARFSGLPDAVRQDSMRTLGRWIEAEIGSLDSASSETYCFQLEIFRFHQKAMS